MQKNDMREKERARKLKGDEPLRPGRWGAPGGAGAPASLPVTSGGGQAGPQAPEASRGRPRVSRTCRDEPQAEEWEGRKERGPERRREGEGGGRRGREGGMGDEDGEENRGREGEKVGMLG